MNTSLRNFAFRKGEPHIKETEKFAEGANIAYPGNGTPPVANTYTYDISNSSNVVTIALDKAKTVIKQAGVDSTFKLSAFTIAYDSGTKFLKTGGTADAVTMSTDIPGMTDSIDTKTIDFTSGNAGQITVDTGVEEGGRGIYIVSITATGSAGEYEVIKQKVTITIKKANLSGVTAAFSGAGFKTDADKSSSTIILPPTGNVVGEITIGGLPLELNVADNFGISTKLKDVELQDSSKIAVVVKSGGNSNILQITAKRGSETNTDTGAYSIELTPKVPVAKKVTGKITISSINVQQKIAFEYNALNFTVDKAGDSFTPATKPQVDSSNIPGIYAIKTGTLPAGLSMEDSTGKISGTPTVSQASKEYVITFAPSDTTMYIAPEDITVNIIITLPVVSTKFAADANIEYSGNGTSPEANTYTYDIRDSSSVANIDLDTTKTVIKQAGDDNTFKFTAFTIAHRSGAKFLKTGGTDDAVTISEDIPGMTGSVGARTIAFINHAGRITVDTDVVEGGEGVYTVSISATGEDDPYEVIEQNVTITIRESLSDVTAAFSGFKAGAGKSSSTIILPFNGNDVVGEITIGGLPLELNVADNFGISTKLKDVELQDSSKIEVVVKSDGNKNILQITAKSGSETNTGTGAYSIVLTPNAEASKKVTGEITISSINVQQAVFFVYDTDDTDNKVTFIADKVGDSFTPATTPQVSSKNILGTYTLIPDVTLPDGLDLNRDTGAISGTPTTPQVSKDYVITFAPTDGEKYVTESITVSIIIAPAEPPRKFVEGAKIEYSGNVTPPPVANTYIYDISNSSNVVTFDLDTTKTVIKQAGDNDSFTFQAFSIRHVNGVNFLKVGGSTDAVTISGVVPGTKVGSSAGEKVIDLSGAAATAGRITVDTGVEEGGEGTYAVSITATSDTGKYEVIEQEVTITIEKANLNTVTAAFSGAGFKTGATISSSTIILPSDGSDVEGEIVIGRLPLELNVVDNFDIGVKLDGTELQNDSKIEVVVKSDGNSNILQITAKSGSETSAGTGTYSIVLTLKVPTTKKVTGKITISSINVEKQKTVTIVYTNASGEDDIFDFPFGTPITPSTPTTDPQSNGGNIPGGYAVMPQLPNGLTMDDGTGIISGTPTTPQGSASYTITFTPADKTYATATVDVAITVSKDISSVYLGTSAMSTYFGVGKTSPVAQALDSNDDPIPGTFVVKPNTAPFPTGIEINRQNGIITIFSTAKLQGKTTYTILFTPNDKNKYTSAEATIDITISNHAPFLFANDGSVTINQSTLGSGKLAVKSDSKVTVFKLPKVSNEKNPFFVAYTSSDTTKVLQIGTEADASGDGDNNGAGLSVAMNVPAELYQIDYIVDFWAKVASLPSGGSYGLLAGTSGMGTTILRFANGLAYDERGELKVHHATSNSGREVKNVTNIGNLKKANGSATFDIKEWNRYRMVYGDFNSVDTTHKMKIYVNDTLLATSVSTDAGTVPTDTVKNAFVRTTNPQDGGSIGFIFDAFEFGGASSGGSVLSKKVRQHIYFDDMLLYKPQVGDNFDSINEESYIAPNGVYTTAPQTAYDANTREGYNFATSVHINK